MKKIMFNDKYGLTQAVLEGRKTMTRRIIPQLVGIKEPDITEWGFDDSGRATICLYAGGRPTTDIYPAYEPEEVVVVAQSYKVLGYTKEWVEQHISPNPNAKPTDPFEKKYPGWSNKMFVPAELNKAHQISITDIKVERLQDISDEDCLKEGIVAGELKHEQPKQLVRTPMPYGSFLPFSFNGADTDYYSAREAFAALIDKVSGKGTWAKNPFVYVYEFKLVK